MNMLENVIICKYQCETSLSGQMQDAAGRTTAATTLKYYIKERHQYTNIVIPIAGVYGLEN